jgi:hypothetical protein
MNLIQVRALSDELVKIAFRTYKPSERSSADLRKDRDRVASLGKRKSFSSHERKSDALLGSLLGAGAGAGAGLGSGRGLKGALVAGLGGAALGGLTGAAATPFTRGSRSGRKRLHGRIERELQSRKA